MRLRLRYVILAVGCALFSVIADNGEEQFTSTKESSSRQSKDLVFADNYKSEESSLGYPKANNATTRRKGRSKGILLVPSEKFEKLRILPKIYLTAGVATQTQLKKGGGGWGSNSGGGNGGWGNGGGGGWGNQNQGWGGGGGNGGGWNGGGGWSWGPPPGWGSGGGGGGWCPSTSNKAQKRLMKAQQALAKAQRKAAQAMQKAGGWGGSSGGSGGWSGGNSGGGSGGWGGGNGGGGSGGGGGWRSEGDRFQFSPNRYPTPVATDASLEVIDDDEGDASWMHSTSTGSGNHNDRSPQLTIGASEPRTFDMLEKPLPVLLQAEL